MKNFLWKDAEDFLSKDKEFYVLIKKYGPCRIRKRKVSDYFLDLVDAIVSQQLSGKAAATIFERARVGVGSGLSPTAILKTPDEKLRNFGLSLAKTKYIKDLSEKVERGDLNLKNLANLSDEAIIEELTKVKGIGRWTAEMFLMFTLARPDVFPIDDLGIQKGFEKIIRKTDKTKMLKYSERWKPHRTVAAWYLWRTLEK